MRELKDAIDDGMDVDKLAEVMDLCEVVRQNSLH